MEIVKQYKENGYLITEYDNGSRTEELIPTAEIVSIEEEQPLSELEELKVELSYNTALLEDLVGM